MIHCLEYYLRKPEFRQDENFRVVIWRRGIERGEEKIAISSNYMKPGKGK